MTWEPDPCLPGFFAFMVWWRAFWGSMDPSVGWWAHLFTIAYCALSLPCWDRCSWLPNCISVCLWLMDLGDPLLEIWHGLSLASGFTISQIIMDG